MELLPSTEGKTPTDGFKEAFQVKPASKLLLGSGLNFEARKCTLKAARQLSPRSTCCQFVILCLAFVPQLAPFNSLVVL